jgi:hypothetical protein
VQVLAHSKSLVTCEGLRAYLASIGQVLMRTTTIPVTELKRHPPVDDYVEATGWSHGHGSR